MEIEQKQKQEETANPENYAEEERDESYHGIYGDAIKIQKARLISLLKCQICCGIYRNPTTINECMHTFCKSCIYKYFNEKTNVPRDSCPLCGVIFIYIKKNLDKIRRSSIRDTYSKPLFKLVG